MEYNCNGVDFMESIEMIFNNALKLLENEDYKKMQRVFKRNERKNKKIKYGKKPRILGNT